MKNRSRAIFFKNQMMKTIPVEAVACWGLTQMAVYAVGS